MSYGHRASFSVVLSASMNGAGPAASLCVVVDVVVPEFVCSA